MFCRQPGVTMAPCLSPASASLKFPTGLETSTSYGVPVLGCHCATCTSSVGEPVPAASTPLAYVPGRARAATVLVAVLDNQIAGTGTYVGDAGSHLAEHQRDGEASLRMLAVPPRPGTVATGRPARPGEPATVIRAAVRTSCGAGLWSRRARVEFCSPCARRVPPPRLLTRPAPRSCL